MARNYGISVLILFLIAEAYPKPRDKRRCRRPVTLPLANTNVIGTLMVGAFLLFWFVDLLDETGVRWTGKLGVTLLSMPALAGAGVVVCAITILPTYNDAATPGLVECFAWSCHS